MLCLFPIPPSISIGSSAEVFESLTSDEDKSGWCVWTVWVVGMCVMSWRGADGGLFFVSPAPVTRPRLSPGEGGDTDDDVRVRVWVGLGERVGRRWSCW